MGDSAVNERTRIKLLLVISIVVLSGTAFMPMTALAGNDAGRGVEDFERCLPLAKQGLASAQFALGLMYFEGLGVPQDYKEAVKWIRKAAGQGDAGAQRYLSHIYLKGLGVPQDYKEAVKWCRKAAEQGFAASQYGLGLMYFQGLGVPQDYKEAVKWYRKAAEQGWVLAQLHLGVTYSEGFGDYKEAVKWYRKAAEQGLSSAQSLLGSAYSNGISVPQNYVESYAWYNISAAQGDEDASKGRDVVAKKLSLEALAKAQELSKEYYKKYVEPFQ